MPTLLTTACVRTPSVDGMKSPSALSGALTTREGLHGTHSDGLPVGDDGDGTGCSSTAHASRLAAAPRGIGLGWMSARTGPCLQLLHRPHLFMRVRGAGPGMATRQGGGDAREPGGSEQLPRGESEQLQRGKVCWRSLRVAGLCVGVDDYQHMRRLQNAVRDAEAVNKELKRIKGCYSEVIRNPTTATDLLHQLRQRLKEPDLVKHPPQLFMLYYAGHGILEHGKMWLVPAHANIPDPDEDLQRECLSLNDLLEMLRKHLDQPVQNQFGAGRAVVFLVVLDACRVQLKRAGFDDLQALEPDAKEAPRKYTILFSCSRKTTASDGPSGGQGPFAAAMCNVSLGFFAKGVALRDAIASVSRVVQSSAGGQAPTVLGMPDALPSDFCINPRNGAAGGSGGAGGGTDAGKRKTREADEELLALLRETGLEKEVDWLAGHGVCCVQDVECLREKDLADLGLRFRKLLDHVKSFQALADSFLSHKGSSGVCNHPGHGQVSTT
jgi:hypothetical protein